MSNLSREQKGETLVFLSLLPWATLPVFTKLAYGSLLPLFTAGASTACAALFFAIFVTIRGKWSDIKTRAVWRDIFLGSLLNGVVFFSLVFWGLQHTTAGNASIILLLEILFTFLFFGIWKKEKYALVHYVGAFLMIVGAFLVLFPGEIAFRKGDLIILLAVMVPPLGNYYQQRARQRVSMEFHLLVRSILGAFFILLLALIFEPWPGISSLQNGFPFLILNGLLGLGIGKLLFLESFHYVSVAKAISLGAAAPVFVLGIAYFVLKEVPTFWQLVGLIPIISGVYFLTRNSFPSPKHHAPH